MTDQMLIQVLVVLVALIAVSMVGQAVAMIGMSIGVKRLIRQLQPTIGKLESLAETSLAVVADNRANMAQVAAQAAQVSRQASEIALRTTELLDLSKTQMQRFDTVWTKAADRASAQIEKAELIVDDTLGRFHETVSTVHGGIMRPILSVNGLANGVRAALHAFVKGPRQSPQRVAQDEEIAI